MTEVSCQQRDSFMVNTNTFKVSRICLQFEKDFCQHEVFANTGNIKTMKNYEIACLLEKYNITHSHFNKNGMSENYIYPITDPFLLDRKNVNYYEATRMNNQTTVNKTTEKKVDKIIEIIPINGFLNINDKIKVDIKCIGGNPCKHLVLLSKNRTKYMNENEIRHLLKERNLSFSHFTKKSILNDCENKCKSHSNIWHDIRNNDHDQINALNEKYYEMYF